MEDSMDDTADLLDWVQKSDVLSIHEVKTLADCIITSSASRAVDHCRCSDCDESSATS